MLHNNVVVVPVVGVVGKNLQFGVGNVPVLIRGGFLQDSAVGSLCEHAFIFAANSVLGDLHFVGDGVE